MSLPSEETPAAAPPPGVLERPARTGAAARGTALPAGGGAGGTGRQGLPPWLHRALPRSARGRKVEGILRELELHTICEEARCPNRAECYARGTATFLVLGDTCTRGCRFCAVARGVPAPPSADEPRRVAEAAARLGLRHVVITMVTRDDLSDGGAAQVAAAVREVRARSGAVVEVLTSDFRGDPAPLGTVLNSAPEVFNHNVETVPRLYRRVRPGSDYRRSLDVLARAARHHARPAVKSGLMVGLGESPEEVEEVLRDLRAAGVELLTVGQYLSPGGRHLPVERFVRPEEFEALADRARTLGFKDVFSGPSIRSSYLAERALERLEAGVRAAVPSTGAAGGARPAVAQENMAPGRPPRG